MSKKRLPGLILAALGIFLCLVGLLNSPTRISLSPVWAFFVSVWESGILLQPGCIGIYGVMIFALAFNTILPREKRQRVRERVKQEIQEAQSKVTSIVENVTEALKPEIRLPKTRDTWVRWRSVYLETRRIRTDEPTLTDAEILGRIQLSFPDARVNTDRTMRDIEKCGREGYLDSWEKFCEKTGRPI